MNEIKGKFIDSLMRFNFILKNEELYSECIKKSDGFSIMGKNFGPFEKGKKYKLKLFEAIPFIDSNILVIADNEKCDNVAVQGYLIAERDESRLVRRDNILFLNRIREFKIFMEKAVRDGAKPQEFLNKYSANMLNLIDSRLVKVLQLSRSELSMDHERRLTSSERMLYKQISKIIKTWRMFFLSSN